MANNVSFRVSFGQINEAAAAKLQEMYSRFRTDDCNFSDMYVDGKEGSPTYEETCTRSWNTDNIGSKWCYLEEYDEEGFFGQSAWAAPEQALFWLAEQLGDEDPELLMFASYEDEGPNFAGWMVFDGVDMWEEDYKDDVQLRKVIGEMNPDVNVEDEDEYYEVLWDGVYEWQTSNFNRAEKEIFNSREFEID